MKRFWLQLSVAAVVLAVAGLLLAPSSSAKDRIIRSGYTSGIFAFGSRATVTVDSATTFDATSSYLVLACTGAETINTITGASIAGTILLLEHSDTDCTIADDDTPTAANAVDLTGAGNDVGAAAKTIALVYNGTSWLELFESDN